MSTPSFRFSAAEFQELAAQRLHATVPFEMTDLSVPAPRSDDDLNRHLGVTFSPVTNPRAAAVLVPLVMRGDELTVLLTRRTDDMPSHPGQVAFPGGKIDVRIQVDKGIVHSIRFFGTYAGLTEIDELQEKLTGIRYDVPSINSVLESVDLSQYFGNIPAEEIKKLLY